MMNFLFGFHGRVRRSHCFFGAVGTCLIANLFGLSAFSSEFHISGGFDAWDFLFTPNPLIALIAGLVGIAAYWISFALAAKRWHDAGASGWLALLALIPGASFALFVLLCLIPGQAGANRYGPDPRTGVAAAA